MKKTIISIAIAAVVILSLASSAMAIQWSQRFGTGTSSPGYDQIQVTWLNGDTFDGISFLNDPTAWNIYSSTKLFIATCKTLVPTSAQKDLLMHFSGNAGVTSFVWQQFNGANLVPSWYYNEVASGTYHVSGPTWSYVANDPTKTGVLNNRLNNPPVPEPGTILAALSILVPAGFVFRRRKMI